MVTPSPSFHGRARIERASLPDTLCGGSPGCEACLRLPARIIARARAATSLPAAPITVRTCALPAMTVQPGGTVIFSRAIRRRGNAGQFMFFVPVRSPSAGTAADRRSTCTRRTRNRSIMLLWSGRFVTRNDDVCRIDPIEPANDDPMRDRGLDLFGRVEGQCPDRLHVRAHRSASSTMSRRMPGLSGSGACSRVAMTTRQRNEPILTAFGSGPGSGWSICHRVQPPRNCSRVAVEQPFRRLRHRSAGVAPVLVEKRRHHHDRLDGGHRHVGRAP